MSKKSFVVVLITVLTVSAFLPLSTYSKNTPKVIPNLDTIIYAKAEGPEAIDPAWAYDSASAEMIQNLYDTLIGLPREVIPSDPQAFDPLLATSWTLSPDGLDYTFTLRPGVTFHGGSSLDASDVEYAIKRGMVLDHVGGPQWMFLYPLTNHLGTAEIDLDDEQEVHDLGVLIDNSVQVIDSSTVRFHLQFPYAPFMQILTQSWAAIYDKDWALGLKAAGREFWGGTWGVKAGWTLDHTEWVDHNDNILGLSAPPMNADGAGNFAPVECGTGPFTLGTWTIDTSYTLNSYVTYWRGWPAPGCARGVTSVRVIFVNSWLARLGHFLSTVPAIQADLVDVPQSNILDLVGVPGVRSCKHLPTLQLSQAECFNFQVAETSLFFDVKPTLGGVTKLDLFGDIHVRKGFAYALDYAQYIVRMYQGEALVPSSPILQGMGFFNGSKPMYNYDLNMAKYHFKMAYGGIDHNPPGQYNTDLVDAGNLWLYGFTTPLPYPMGGTSKQQLLLEMLKFSIEVEIAGWGVVPSLTLSALPWSIYIQAMLNSELPYWAIGYFSEIGDPAFIAHAFWHSAGELSKLQRIDWSQIRASDFDPTSGRKIDATHWRNELGLPVSSISNADVDALVMTGGQAPSEARRKYYEYLVDLWYAEMPTMPVAQPLMRHWERDWVQGWYYNPQRLGYYFYEMWKGLDADMNGDGTVDASEIGQLNVRWNDPPYYVGDYSYLADITYPGRQPSQCREMDGDDYIKPGADGAVNLADKSLVMQQYLDYVIQV